MASIAAGVRAEAPIVLSRPINTQEQHFFTRCVSSSMNSDELVDLCNESPTAGGH